MLLLLWIGTLAFYFKVKALGFVSTLDVFKWTFAQVGWAVALDGRAQSVAGAGARIATRPCPPRSPPGHPASLLQHASFLGVANNMMSLAGGESTAQIMAFLFSDNAGEFGPEEFRQTIVFKSIMARVGSRVQSQQLKQKHPAHAPRAAPLRRCAHKPGDRSATTRRCAHAEPYCSVRARPARPAR